MRNTGLEEAQAESRLPGEILIYTNDTTLMAESEEELNSLLMKGEEENEKADLKFNIQKSKIMALVPLLHGKSKEKN